MSVTVVREEGGSNPIYQHLVINASGMHLHLESSLETKDEIRLLVTPDEPDWEILAQGDPDDERGVRLILRRV